MGSLEATSLLLGALVAAVTLVSAVWYSAVSINNRSRDISFMKEELTVIKDSLEEISIALRDKNERLEEVERTLEDVIKEMVKLIYINSDHILLEAYDGRVVKIPTM